MTNSAASAPAPIRVGIVGVGNWAQHGHVRVLSLLPQYELTAVYSQRRDAALSVAERYGFKYVADSLTDLVEHPEVDLVIILTTAPQHEHGVRAAIAAGKNVYCEWPLTPNVDRSRELTELANKAGVRHVVGLQRRLADRRGLRRQAPLGPHSCEHELFPGAAFERTALDRPAGKLLERHCHLRRALPRHAIRGDGLAPQHSSTERQSVRAGDD
jgi:hypothetical protein